MILMFPPPMAAGIKLYRTENQMHLKYYNSGQPDHDFPTLMTGKNYIGQ